ncbi:Hypothetical protein HEAR1173 [Herminiimonas arsenicoxydans]|uniref:Uncharacterized protein n=1 Tax=Herminiimonas arsenicoxydans TaxID=204773 RepID=A4G4B4_HERAR|nr:Hypothetical protein HEAR1173 [Herminiimonas arsenicoxydans]
MHAMSLSTAIPPSCVPLTPAALIRAHKAPVPVPVEEPLPGEHPVPQEEPVPSPNPEVDNPQHTLS